MNFPLSDIAQSTPYVVQHNKTHIPPLDRYISIRGFGFATGVDCIPTRLLLTISFGKKGEEIERLLHRPAETAQIESLTISNGSRHSD